MDDPVTGGRVEVVTIGESMAALRGDGPFRLGGALTLSMAGAETNVAIGLARLGHRVRWAGVVGADELGELVLRTLRAEGVDVGTVRTDPAAPTGLLLQEHRVAHVTRVHYYRSGSAGSSLDAADAETALADGPPRILHVTGITPALGPGPRAAVERAVRRARRAGTRVCLDVNYRARLWAPDLAARVLIVIARNPHSRLRDIADAIGITERAAQTIVNDLEEAGYINRTRIGRRNHYSVDPTRPFRHPADADHRIEGLLTVFTDHDHDQQQEPAGQPQGDQHANGQAMSR